MQHSLDVLEFPLIKANLASFASTSLGKGRIESLSLLPLDDLKVEWENLTFAWDAIYVHGHFPVSSSVDCSKPLAMAHRGYRLSGEDFRNLIVNIDNAVALKRYFASLEGDSPLRKRATNLQDLSSLAMTIDSVVSSDGSLRDNASPELKRLRNNIARLEDRKSVV